MSFQVSKAGGGEGHESSSESDGEDQDESSSSFQITNSEDVLASFREIWQKELLISPQKSKTIARVEKNYEDEGKDLSEDNAKVLYLRGIEMEKSGQLYEAIRYYRRAVQIDPDVESKLDHVCKAKPKRERRITTDSEEGIPVLQNSSSDDTDNEDIKEGELLPRIQKKLSKVASLCTPKFDQRATHISVLPIEIILLILRWIVSSDLDLRSLETFSAVCRGFYLCSRDPEIWRLACLRVWGLSCGSTPADYSSWRNMFIEKARVQFNGCYISKTTYIRHGENSFQDQFYRPWHFVAYYRYFRFFPDGLVLMLTSAEEPSQCVSQMRYRSARNPVLSGYYRLKDDKVIIFIQREEPKIAQAFKKNKKRDGLDNANQTLHMELQIRNHRKKRHIQLIWSHYSVFSRTKKGDESTCDFDLVTSRFPPFWFSRVKSYTYETEAPLQ